MSKPFVSVVVPVFNAAEHLAEALESLVNQTWPHFEVLIFNDGSTDKSLGIMQSFAEKDERFMIINDNRNVGYVPRLNDGITQAKGKYIARMDADDISLPTRLEQQVKLMEKHPDVGICGTWFESFDQAGKVSVTQYPTDDSHIRLMMFYQNAFCHPSVMMRADVLSKHNLAYDPDFMPAEDFHLWIRIGAHTKFANLPQVLLQYRLHEKNISYVEEEKKRTFTKVIIQQHFKKMHLDLSDKEIALYTSIAYSYFKSEKDFIKNVELLLLQIWRANEKTGYLPKQLFREFIAQRWFHICTNATSLGWWVAKKYSSSQLPKNSIQLNDKIKLFAKTVLP